MDLEERIIDYNVSGFVFFVFRTSSGYSLLDEKSKAQTEFKTL